MNAFCPCCGPTASNPVRHGTTQEMGHGVRVVCGVEFQPGAFCILIQQALALKAAACTLTDQLNQILQIAFVRRPDALKSGRPVIAVDVYSEQLETLRELLLAGPIANGYGADLWTLKRVRLLIEKHFGIAYSDVHVWRILGSLGFSSQKPEKRAIECNEEAVVQWKKFT